jgi:ABC-type multidrug transport system ATPase subunit
MNLALAYQRMVSPRTRTNQPKSTSPGTREPEHSPRRERQSEGQPEPGWPTRHHSEGAASRKPAVVSLVDVTRTYGSKVAVDGVSFSIDGGEIRALLGPNGAGKTTILRLLCGVTEPSSGTIRIDGEDPVWQSRGLRARIGLLPSGDRSLYLRISGLENLLFFARLHGMGRRAALERSWAVLEEVGLVDAAKAPASTYSHGMQKRLAVARALLAEPRVLLIDEATHDLDPESARRVRELVRNRARAGAAVVWTTQRIEEVRGFADVVTVLHGGRIRFSGGVTELMSHARPRRYVLALSAEDAAAAPDRATLARAIASMGVISPLEAGASRYYVLALQEDVVLGDALFALTASGVKVHACREERPEIEEAFLTLTEDDPT